MPPRFEIAEFEWSGVQCRVRVEANYRGNAGWSRIDIQVLTPTGHPLPIAESGTHSHQLDADELAAAGGPVAFYRAWLEKDSRHYRYTKALDAYHQADLFGSR